LIGDIDQISERKHAIMSDHKSTLVKQTLLFFTFLLFISFIPNSVSGQDDAVIAQGQSVFMANCASCHKVNNKVLIGPGLKGLSERWEDEEKLYKWIRNSQAYLKEESDSYAKQLYAEYNKSVMPAFNLKDEEIAAVLAYIENPPATPGGGGGDEETAVAEELTITSPIVIFMLLTAAILIAIALLVSRLLRTLKNMSLERQGLPVPEAVPFLKQITSKSVLAPLSILLVIGLCFLAFEATSNMGRQQNYEPAQPIAFSHKLHAGINGVDCQYCHSGARKGKSAVIPSAMVCMNCHKAVAEGPEYGTEEIAKIYDAVDWDVETQTFGDNPKPIEWVRIHNLPDHVYFNHSQHVVAGQVECQTCHGNVEEMDKVKQVETLGMGWCIDCHRETEVQFVSNDYYKIYKDLHEDVKNGGTVTVEDIGGTECQKCHY